METPQPLTRDLFAALTQNPGHIRTSGRIIGGQLFIIFREEEKK